jgi:transposase
MATIIKKIKSGHPYYYAVESARVEGKPRIVWQKYLGTVESIIQRSEQARPPRPKETEVFQFGAVAALYRITQRLGLTEILDRCFPKREQGPSLGQFLVLAAINRAIDPKSKVKIGPWYAGTVLQRIFKHPARVFSSQRFWDAMDAIDVSAIPRVEKEIVMKAMDVFGIHPDYLLYDTTNFFTFIDTFNDRSGLPQRGKSKAKRNDLRQVGLALLVTNECHIPLLHHLYEGNLHDSTVFRSLTTRMASFLRALASSLEEVTIIFDKGNVSEENFSRLAAKHISFVAALPCAHHKDLLDVPLSSFTPTSPRLPGVRSFRTSKEIFGRKRTVVVKFSEGFYTKQLANFSVTITKCTTKLLSLSKELLAWQEGRKTRGRRPTPDSVKKRVQRILKAQHMKDVFKVSVLPEKGSAILTFSTDQEKIREITDRSFGKTILTSDREHWSDEQIIRAYHGQYEIEQAFRDMKDPLFLRWQPAFHWTDQKIHVHAFYCVLALLLVGIARYQLQKEGLFLSPQEMLAELTRIHEVALLYPKHEGAYQKPHFALSRMNTLQKKLAKILSLQELFPGKG